MIGARSLSLPVYVLGAGFAKAINEEMPLTDELGATIRARLKDEIDLTELDSQSFEEWLTLRVTAMPFLERYENAKRLSEAERVIAEVASVIKEKTERASANPLPLWLAQLIALWQAEHALVITFNYDTLLERAINDVRPTTPGNSAPNVSFADAIVHPAPQAPSAAIYADLSSSRETPFQVLKPHGSINWHWSSGDPTGSTLTRTRERSTFSGNALYNGDRDSGGASLLDHFLTPPVTSKASYYSLALAQILWRSASAAIHNATSVSLIGYSMPPADLTTVELLRRLGAESTLNLVDAFPGSRDVPTSLAARVSGLGSKELAIWGGQSCVQNFVNSRITAASDSLASALMSDIETEAHKSVLISRASDDGLNSRGYYLALAIRPDNEIVGIEMSLEKLRDLRSSALEAALNTHPRGTWKAENLINYGRLRELAAKHRRLIIRHDGRRYIAIALEHAPLEHTHVAHLHLAPID